MIKDHELIAPEYYNIALDIDRYAEGEEKVAIYWEDDKNNSRIITYRELRDLSNQLGNALRKMGLQKGDTIIVMLPRSPETYIVFLAALKLGLIVSPGTEMLRENDLRYRIHHSQAKAIISYHTLLNRVDSIRQDVDCLKHFIAVGPKKQPGWENYHKLIEQEPAVLRMEQTLSRDLAFLGYTSGTTGSPKGALHDHKWAYAHRAVAAKYWLDVQSTDVVWCTVSPGWVKWVQNALICTLGSGAASLSYQGTLTAERYLQLLEKYNVSVLCATPTEYRLIAKAENLEGYHLPHLRNTLSAGEPLDTKVLDTFKKYFHVMIRDGYGQTENTLLVATIAGMESKTGSMGKPTVGNLIDIIDEQGRPVQPGEVGTIAVHRKLPSLFRGYLHDPERTTAAFRGDWYITGDLAKKDEDGYYWFTGRADDIIISSGYTIGPSEVEEALAKHPLVKECAVVASPDKVRGSIVKAFVTLAEDVTGSQALIEELQNHVKQYTAPYKYPREIEFVPTLPKTASGKIRRVELRQLEKERKQLEQQA